jgi:hypothetical protein
MDYHLSPMIDRGFLLTLKGDDFEVFVTFMAIFVAQRVSVCS